MPLGFKTVRELIADLRIEIRELTSRVKGLEQEWDETYDKMTRKAARDRKRARDDAAATEGEGPVSPIRPMADDGLPPRIAARRRAMRGLPSITNGDHQG